MFKKGGKVKKGKKRVKVSQPKAPKSKGLRPNRGSEGGLRPPPEGQRLVSERAPRSFHGYTQVEGMLPRDPQRAAVALSGAGFMTPQQFLLEKRPPFFSYSTGAMSPIQSPFAPRPYMAPPIPSAPPLSAVEQQIQTNLSKSLDVFQETQKQFVQEQKKQEEQEKKRMAIAKRAYEKLVREDKRRAEVAYQKLMEKHVGERVPVEEEKHAMGPPPKPPGVLLGPIPKASPIQVVQKPFQQQLQEEMENQRKRTEKRLMEEERILRQAERGLKEAMRQEEAVPKRKLRIPKTDD